MSPGALGGLLPSLVVPEHTVPEFSFSNTHSLSVQRKNDVRPQYDQDSSLLNYRIEIPTADVGWYSPVIGAQGTLDEINFGADRSGTNAGCWTFRHVLDNSEGPYIEPVDHPAAKLDTPEGLALLDANETQEMLKSLSKDIQTRPIYESLERVETLAANVKIIKTDWPKSRYEPIFDMLDKLDPTDPVYLQAGRNILQSLYRALPNHYVDTSLRGFALNAGQEQHAQCQKQIVKHIVRNAHRYMQNDVDDPIAGLIVGLIRMGLFKSSGARQFDAQGALVRHLEKQFHRYPAAARAEIAAVAMKNLGRFSEKPPAGHTDRFRWPATAVSVPSVTGAAILTSFAAMSLAPPLVPVAATLGSVAAVSVGAASYNGVRSKYRDSIQERVFKNIVLADLDPTQRANMKTRLNAEQYNTLIAQLRVHAAPYANDPKLSKFSTALEEALKHRPEHLRE
jgi:hypothetical protein